MPHHIRTVERLVLFLVVNAGGVPATERRGVAPGAPECEGKSHTLVTV